VEDEQHVFFACVGNLQLRILQNAFLTDVTVQQPEFSTMICTLSPYQLLWKIIACQEVVGQWAKYVFDVFTVFHTKEEFVPALYLYVSL
jgi:hypothetical protein